jgi:hypothetical protein
MSLLSGKLFLLLKLFLPSYEEETAFLIDSNKRILNLVFLEINLQAVYFAVFTRNTEYYKF